MYDVRQTEEFVDWLDRLDKPVQARIALRLARVADGNLGDHHSVGGGVSEMRMTLGPGYRLYFAMRRNVLVVILAGGDKSSQGSDIDRARQLASELGDL